MVLAVACDLKEEFQLGSSAVARSKDEFGALTKDEVISLLLLDLQLGLGGEGEVVLRSYYCLHHELLSLHHLLLLQAVLGVALNLALKLPNAVWHHCHL